MSADATSRALPVESGGSAEAPRAAGLLSRMLRLLDPLRDRWTALLASPEFQRRAAAFPLTRPIALSRSRQLFDLLSGFVYSQTVLALVRLDLFDRLKDGGQPVDRLYEALGLPPDRLERLLGAGVALGLLRRSRDGRTIGLGHLGAPLAGNQALARMIEHNTLLYRDLQDPIALIANDPDRSMELQGYWAYAGGRDPRSLQPSEVAAYSSLMAGSQPLVATEILDGYDFAGHERVLDLGGGEGAFLLAVANRHPELELELFDLPAVAERARVRIAALNESARIRAHGGDFLVDPLPEGADLITLVRILHDHDDDAVVRLLRRARAAVHPGGSVLVAEPMAGVRGAETVGAAYFALYLLAMGQGRPRSPAELSGLLKTAGFTRVRRPRHRSPVLTSLLVARP